MLGIRGLTLACVLHVHGITATVYEAEPSVEARAQGGQIDIHEHNGQLALAAAGLTEEFRAIVRVGGEASRMVDPHGTVLLDEPDDGTGGRPEVLRGDLRRIPHDIEVALAAYEEAMFPRSESAAADARIILDLCLGDRAPFGLIDFFTGALEGEHESHEQS